jgi:glyoxylase-like metal-dependent hydrolase (beta-lactamase superfamily II)
MNLYSIETEYFKLDGGAMFGVVPKVIWNEINPADEKNLCTWAMRCLLIEDAGRLILIDNGIGDKQDEKFLRHYYLHGEYTLDKSLAKHGFNRDDITDVFLTHLHFDHCGGSIIREGDKLVPAFKNAVYWSNEEHWQWATEPNDREKASFLKENILPIKESGQLKFTKYWNTDLPGKGWQVSNDSMIKAAPFFENISIRYTYGHTTAMMLPQIKYKDQIIVYMADLLPSAGHIPLPYVMAYDMFPLTTLYEKKAFLNEALENKYILFFEHDPKIECCNLEQTERGIRMGQSFLLNDIC